MRDASVSVHAVDSAERQDRGSPGSENSFMQSIQPDAGLTAVPSQRLLEDRAEEDEICPCERAVTCLLRGVAGDADEHRKRVTRVAERACAASKDWS